MQLSEGFSSEDVIVGSNWATFDDAIAGLVDHLVSNGRLDPKLAETATRTVREREAISSTAMVDIGVSIPHARIDGVDGLVAVMAVSANAVYRFGANVPISIVALVLSSPSLAGDHLNFLSSLSLLLQSARTREALRNAESVETVMKLVHESANRPSRQPW